MDDRQGMETRRQQRTLRTAASVEGIGYWSGRDVHVEFRPAGPNEGIVFVRRDLPGCPRIPAAVGNRIEMPRRTVLCAGGGGKGGAKGDSPILADPLRGCPAEIGTVPPGMASVEMVEHIMAALAGMHVDNCEIWVDAPEMPGCDGSAKAFAEAIRRAGTIAQGALRELFVVREVLRLGNEECWIEARPAAGGKTIIQYDLDYGSGNPIGRQSLEVTLAPRFFELSLAPARTFMLQHEAAALQSRGLGQRTTFNDLLIFDGDGPIGNALRFPDECVRHKILDMVGDLALAGCDMAGRFAAYRSGHRLNAELVKAMLDTRRALKRCA
jgi:UDP-3-O-[3-hydroxymyristoyl] N-acetylglucosamine deacetylase